ncbi:hypothetical protein Dimus_028844 [Dionaea muscipula]
MTSFMDLTYTDYLLTRKKVNLPRGIIRYMAYVINVPHHEFPYGELLTRVFETFEVPLDDKEGEEPVETNNFEETFLGMCQLRREDGIWWLGSGANRRRDEVEVEAMNEEENVPENVEVEEENSENTVEKDKTAKSTPVGFQREQVKGEQHEQDVDIAKTVAQPVKQQGKTTGSGVDPSGIILDYDLLHLQAEMNRALKANIRFQELYQNIKPNPPTSPRP